MALLQQIRLYKITRGTLLMCQNTTMRVNGPWIERYCVLCTNTMHSCHNFPAGSRQVARGACICEKSISRSQGRKKCWFDPVVAFPDNNSSLNGEIGMKLDTDDLEA